MKIRSLEVLDAMDALENKIGEVPYTNTTSLITFLEAVPLLLLNQLQASRCMTGVCGVFYMMSVGNQTVQSVQLGPT